MSENNSTQKQQKNEKEHSITFDLSSIGSTAWTTMCIVFLFLILAMNLTLVTISMLRTDLGYSIHTLKVQIEKGQEHINKLEVERESLLSPYELHTKAKELGLHVASPGQIRRLF